MLRGAKDEPNSTTVTPSGALAPDPAASRAAAGHAAAVVDAYFGCVAAGYPDAVASLFAEEAVLQNAAGTLIGSAAIKRMYQNGLKPGAMRPNPRKMVVDGNKVAVEIDLVANGQSMTLADFFTIVEGKIQRLAIYSLTPDEGRFFDKAGVDPGGG